MSLIEQVPPPLLVPAMEAARRALRRLDAKEVPASLRKVANYGGGKLPRPLARSLVRALDEDGWLRGKAVDEWDRVDADAPGPDGASALFLLRPTDWEYRIGVLAGATEVKGAAADQAGLRRALDQADARAEEARRRLGEAHEEIVRLREQHRAEVEKVRAELRSARRKDRAQDQALRGRLTAIEADLLQARKALAETERTAVELRRRLQVARRDRAGYERRLIGRAAASPWVGEDPLTIARFLDEVATASRLVPPAPPSVQPVPVAAGFRLPAGVAPDSAAALDWLFGLTAPLTLLVDGYNVTFLVSEANFSEDGARRYLNQELATLKRRLPARSRVVVVYDSSHGEGETMAGPGGIEVRFTRAGSLADDELRELATSIEGPVVVVSTDRAVRQAAEGSGAVGLWSESLVAWLRRRR